MESIKKHRNEMKIEFDNKLNQTETTMNKKQEEATTKIKEMEKSIARYKALQNLKLIDYQKELGFWRNMIRKLLFDSSKKSFKNADEIISKITEELKTYSTREKINLDLDTAMHYASWANDKK